MAAVIPAHVLSAFQLDGIEGRPLGGAWEFGTRFGRVVVAEAGDTSAWSGKAREKIGGGPRGLLRVARPVRATDGRLIVGGFRADEFAEGEARARIDETIAAALRYDDAAADIPAPPAQRSGVRAAADRAVWRGFTPDSGDVVAHLDFLSHTLYDGDLPPFLTSILPSVDLRPRGYTAALVMVDGLLAGAVDNAVVDRWAHVPGIRELAAKALEYRQECADGTDSNAGANFARVAGIVSA